MGKRDIWDLPRQLRYKGAVISPIRTRQGLRYEISHSQVSALFSTVRKAREHIVERRRLQRLGSIKSIYVPHRPLPIKRSPVKAVKPKAPKAPMSRVAWRARIRQAPTKKRMRQLAKR